MITKEQLVNEITHEFNVMRHLGQKATEEQLSYRPSDSQRTLLELMQYVSYVFTATAEAVINGDQTVYPKMSEEAKSLTLANFDERMQAQAERVRELVMPMTEEQANEEVMVFMKATRATYVLNMLKWAAAYKLQMFLYLKASGHSHLNTMNAWAGMDGEMNM